MLNKSKPIILTHVILIKTNISEKYVSKCFRVSYLVVLNNFRPTVAGIQGNESIGCFSIALSGGYEDDLDYGESFTFTGSGK